MFSHISPYLDDEHSLLSLNIQMYSRNDHDFALLIALIIAA